jgi:hypothetical protein
LFFLRSYLLQNHTAFASRLQYLGLPAASEPRAAAEQVLRCASLPGPRRRRHAYAYTHALVPWHWSHGMATLTEPMRFRDARLRGARSSWQAERCSAAAIYAACCSSLFVRYSDPMLANEIMALIFGTAELQVLSACARRRLGVWACMCRLYLGAALAPRCCPSFVADHIIACCNGICRMSVCGTARLTAVGLCCSTCSSG